jgi:hypothetical protein
VSAPSEELRAAAVVARQNQLWPHAVAEDVAAWFESEATAAEGGTAGNLASALKAARSVVAELPLISPEGLGHIALAGGACAACGKVSPLPERIAGRTPDGRLIRVCEDCRPELEAVR